MRPNVAYDVLKFADGVVCHLWVYFTLAEYRIYEATTPTEDLNRETFVLNFDKMQVDNEEPAETDSSDVRYKLTC